MTLAALAFGPLRQVDRFRSPRPIERVAILPVRNYGPPPLPYPFPVRHRFAQVWVPGCLAGDVLDVTFNMQASNGLSYQVELAWSLRLTQLTGTSEGISIPGTSKATNITWAQHHCPVCQSGQIEVPSAGDWWAIAMVYAGGGSQSQSGDQITVDLGYGDFVVTRHRKH